MEQRLADAATVPLWAREAVAMALREGLLAGYPQADGTLAFRGEEAVKRVELAAVVARILATQKKEVKTGEYSFTDADSIPVWAREAVRIVVAEGIIKGYPDNAFRPGRKVTRAETVAVLGRLVEGIALTR